MYFALRTGFVCTPLLFLQNINQQELQSKLIYICNYNWKIPSLLIFTFVNTLPFSIKNSIFPGIPGNSKCFFDKLLLFANIMLNKRMRIVLITHYPLII